MLRHRTEKPKVHCSAWSRPTPSLNTPDSSLRICKSTYHAVINAPTGFLILRLVPELVQRLLAHRLTAGPSSLSGSLGARRWGGRGMSASVMPRPTCTVMAGCPPHVCVLNLMEDFSRGGWPFTAVPAQCTLRVAGCNATCSMHAPKIAFCFTQTLAKTWKNHQGAVNSAIPCC